MEKTFTELVNPGLSAAEYKSRRSIKKDLSSFLKYIPIFSCLDENALRLLTEKGEQKSFGKNSVVVLENEPGSSLYVIIKGKLKVSRLSYGGKETILTILKKSDIFGEMAIFDDYHNSARVTAVEDSVLFILDGAEFLNLLKEHLEIALTLMKELVARIRSADMKIKSLSLNNAEGKVAAAIIELVKKIGKIEQNKAEIDKLPFQHVLAKMAATSRETISRTLHSLAKRNLIELNKQKITINDYNKFVELFE